MSDENHDSIHASGRKRITNRQYSAEDQALNQIASEAETRLAAKRAARAEARDIRLKELERQQREQEDKTKQQELANEANRLPVASSSSRRSSDDSSETGRESPRELKDATREFKQQLREMEEKYKRAMVTNAQLDNEKHTLVYQVELLKDQMEEQDEGYTQVQREYKEKSRDCDQTKRTLGQMENDFNFFKKQLEQKDRLIEESGFVIMSSEDGGLSLEKSSGQNGPVPSSGSALISTEMAEILEKAGEGSLGTCVPSTSVKIIGGLEVHGDEKTGEGTLEEGSLGTCGASTSVKNAGELEVHGEGKSKEGVSAEVGLTGREFESGNVASNDNIDSTDSGLDMEASNVGSEHQGGSEVGAAWSSSGGDDRSDKDDHQHGSESEDEFYDAPTTPKSP